MATIRICNEDGCQRKHAALGLCQRHYNAAPAGRASNARYERTPARKAAQARYNATPARKAAQARNSAAYKERQQSHPETPTAPTLVPMPGDPQPDLETRQRALMRAMVKAAQETTTWDAQQYLLELLAGVTA